MSLAKFDLKRLFRRHEQDAVLHHIEMLQANVASAVKYLKERLVEKKAFQEMPWYLVIGDKASGKSQVIQQSGFSFLEKERFTQITPSHHETEGTVNWWISPSCVMIDVPGYYLEESPTLTPPRAAWLELLHQIRRCRFMKPLNGIVLVLDFQELNKPSFLETIKMLKSRLLEITYQLKQPLPIYVIVTKCDMVQGFDEYFDDLGKEERDQCCGLTFPLDFISERSWTDQYHQQFDEWIHRLHQRALWRVHQEVRIPKRKVILNFPHQMENCREPLKKMMYSFSTLTPSVFLRGIYFTASRNHGETQATPVPTPKIDYVSDIAQKRYDLVPCEESHEHTALTYQRKNPQQKSFFIPAIFQHKILSESYLSYTSLQGLMSPWENVFRWGAVGISGIILSSALVFFTHEYHQQTRYLGSARTAISDYRLLSISYNLQQDKVLPDVTKLLPALNALAFAVDNTHRANLPWLLRFQFHFKNSLSQQTRSLYTKELAKKFVPALHANLEEKLSEVLKNPAQNSQERYGLLKAYLMLASPEHFDAIYLKQWFFHDFEKFHDPLMQNADFKKHLEALLNLSPEERTNFLVLSNNADVVSQARTDLNHLSYSELSEAIFSNNYFEQKNRSFHLENAHHVFSAPSLLQLSLLPDRHSRELSVKINQSLLEATKGNWVLGENTTRENSADKISVLRKNLLTLYRDQQRKQTEEFLSSIKLNKFMSVAQLDLGLQELTSKASPLTQILNFLQLASMDNPAIGERYQKIPLKVILSDLQSLESEIIRPLLSGSEHGANALLMAQNIAKQTPQKILLDKLSADFGLLPEPFKSWLLGITQQSRELIFSQGLTYANQIWQKQIYPVCQKTITNYYPFDPNAEKNISLKDFSRVFEKNGILQQFMTLYLLPFVDMTQAKWEWKNIDGLTFSQNKSFLAQMERADILRSLYFNNSNQLNAAFKFTTRGHTQQYSWPTKMPNLTANSTESETDPWLMFRQLREGKLKTSDNQTYTLLFNNNQYSFTPASPINPFIDILNNVSVQFKCPEGM